MPTGAVCSQVAAAAVAALCKEAEKQRFQPPFYCPVSSVTAVYGSFSGAAGVAGVRINRNYCAVFKESRIYPSGGPGICPAAVHLIVFKVTDILLAVCPGEGALSGAYVVLEFALINIAAGVGVDAGAVFEIVFVSAGVGGSVSPFI